MRQSPGGGEESDRVNERIFVVRRGVRAREHRRRPPSRVVYQEIQIQEIRNGPWCLFPPPFLCIHAVPPAPLAEADQGTQLAVVELGQRGLSARKHGFGQPALAGEQLGDTVFHGSLGNQVVHVHGAVLPDPVRPVGDLEPPVTEVQRAAGPQQPPEDAPRAARLRLRRPGELRGGGPLLFGDLVQQPGGGRRLRLVLGAALGGACAASRRVRAAGREVNTGACGGAAPARAAFAVTARPGAPTTSPSGAGRNASAERSPVSMYRAVGQPRAWLYLDRTPPAIMGVLTSDSHAAARALAHPRGSASNSRRYTERAVSLPGRTAVAHSGSGDGLATS